MLVLPNSEVKRAEAEADARSLSYEMMMTNAGYELARVIDKHLNDSSYCLILCGRGRNAGDGYVAARALYENGKQVYIAELYSDGYDSLTQKMRQKVSPGIVVIDVCGNFERFCDMANTAGVICDAVFGTGFRGELSGICADAIKAANESTAVRIAADVPSGLSAVSTLYFHADETVCMLSLKDIHALKPTASACGRITVAYIGIEQKYITSLEGAYELISHREASALLPERGETAHKGTFGHALIAAGSYRMPGAAVLAARAALRSGAGLLTTAFPDAAYAAIAPQIPESILMPLAGDNTGAFSEEAAAELAAVCNKYSAVAAGCGMTTGDGAEKVIHALIENYKGTLIIDADGLNIVSKDVSVLKKRVGQTVLTPHPGEMSRLTGKSIAEIENDRFTAARDFSEEYGVTLLLKGHNTLIVSPDGKTRLVTEGTNALSRGGAGDMLTGIIVSLASYINNVFDAVSLAAYIHGRAGLLAGEELSCYSCAVGDIADRFISEAIKEIQLTATDARMRGKR